MGLAAALGAARSAPAEEPAALPAGALLEPSGFATIADAPPAPFTPAEPGAPPPLTPDQRAAHQRLARAGAFQNRVMAEVTALDARLRRAAAGNYVGLYFDNDGEAPRAVFQFLRDAPATLARFTRNPSFVARDVRFSEAELQTAADFMLRTFEADRVIQGAGIGVDQVDVTIAVTEAEFRALVARKSVTLPEPVQLTFAAGRPAAALNAPLPPAIAALVRIFPRSDRPIGLRNDINTPVKVELRDGCFRTAEGDLILFPLGTRLFVDREGYLAFGDEVPGYGRVGEPLVFHGSIGEVSVPGIVAPIRDACGPGRVVAIGGTGSAAAHRAQRALTENVQAVGLLRESYGLTEDAARRAARRCAEMSGGTICLMTPPPPVRGDADCPAGTRLSFGLCRTPQGHIRPIPGWLREFVDAS